MVSVAADLMMKSLAVTTRKSYQKIFKDFYRYLVKLDCHNFGFPASPLLITMYITDLFKGGCSPSTITTKLSALSFCHKIYFLSDPTSHYMVRRTLLGIKKETPTRLGRPAMSLKGLNKMVVTLGSMGWSPYESSLMKAMILTSFHGFLRAGEMVDSVNSLKIDQCILSSSSVKIIFLRFKHSRGRPITIKIRRTSSNLCPVRALADYLCLRGFWAGNLFCLADVSPVPYTWYNKRFKLLVKFSDLDPSLGTHSLRMGAATYAASCGFSDDEIKRMGRWFSSAVKKYIKLPVICL
ncbi:MAG: hypothetical protein GY705_03145 [Bacteroidetes bacterium]|nr:hypothetical protein [Bacteroidota bacterium]